MILAGVLAVLMGLVLGLLGGGGSVLTVPLLVYAVGLGAKEAIATSLVAVAVTSAVGAMMHARQGNVKLRTALVFGIASMVGAYGGGEMAALVPGDFLLLGFGALMVATGIAMVRGRKDAEGTTKTAGLPLLLADGIAVGAVTGLVGAGGGFLIVPALVMLVGLDMRAAIGTSLAIIALNASAAFLGHLGHTQVDWSLVAVVTSMAVVGLFAGVAAGKRVAQASLKKAFGGFVLAMAAFILHRQGAGEMALDLLGPAGMLALLFAMVAALAGVLARRLQTA